MLNDSSSTRPKDACRQPGARAMGRTELAARYFPAIQPKSAWEKLKMLLLDEPELCQLATMRRRTFLPAEVSRIYELLGQP